MMILIEERLTEQCLRDLLDVCMINDSTTEQVEGMTWLRGIVDTYCKKIGYAGLIDAYHVHLVEDHD